MARLAGQGVAGPSGPGPVQGVPPLSQHSCRATLYDPPVLDHPLLLVLLGFVVGTAGTLIGAGGGFLLVPALLLLDPQADPRSVTAISLAVVFANAVSGSLAYARTGRIDYRAGLAFALATLPGAALGAWSTAWVSRGAFSALFGALLVLLGLTLARPVRPVVSPTEALPPRAPSRSWWVRRWVDPQGAAHEWAFDVRIGVGLSLGIGYLSSLLGIGGGVVHVPALVHLLRFPVHVATATSQFTLVFTALTGTAVHVAGGELSARPVLLELALLVAGVLPGAQVGARLAGRVRGKWILRVLALALVLVGARLIVAGLRG